MEVIHHHPHHSLAETVERLRVVNNFDERNWLDLLNLNWLDYTKVRSGLSAFPEKSLLNLSEHFNYGQEDLLQGSINFQKLQVERDASSWQLPEQYSVATYGRGRTTITSFEYLEKYYGWRLRHDLLKTLNLSESVLMDSFSPISMKVITDTFAQLAKRQFSQNDFFAMGMYSYVGNANTIVGQYYSRLNSPREVLEHMWGDCLKFYEKNCIYRFLNLDEQGGRLEVISDPQVAEEMQVRHLGNKHICALKAGMMASGPMCLGHAPARVVETQCVHRGDPSCIFEITFAPPPNSLAYAARF